MFAYYLFYYRSLNCKSDLCIAQMQKRYRNTEIQKYSLSTPSLSFNLRRQRSRGRAIKPLAQGHTPNQVV